MENNARNSFIKNYFNDLQHCIRYFTEKRSREINKVVDILLEARKENKLIFTFGNGGSGSTASHFACDLNKGTVVENKKRFRVIALTDNIPTMLAWANDEEYNDIFLEQFKNFREVGCVLIGFSGSGNSINVIKPMVHARAFSGETIGFTGMGGGDLKKFVDICLTVPSNNMQRIEDMHLVLTHLITLMLRREISEE